MPLSPQELDTLRTVLKNLQSEKYKNKNYLFLRPFDLSQVPGYLNVVSKPLDLFTVSQNVEQNKYGTMAEAWAEIRAIFENAIKYHSDKPTKWIAKLAKDMLKVVAKEKSKAEKPKLKTEKVKAEKAKTEKPKIKLKLSNTKQGKQLPASAPAKQGKQLPTSAPDAVPAPSSAPPAVKKPKIKLKLPTQQQKPSPTNAQPPVAAPAPAGVPKSKPTAVKAKPTQAKPKLKLKLSMKKKTETTPTPPSSTTAKPKISLKLGSNSRGKELPKAVQSSQAAAGKPKKTTTATKKVKIKKGGPGMTPQRQRQCQKVLHGLRRRQHKQINWFVQPVSDKSILKDYKTKIKHPMDISTMTAKLERGSYHTMAAFVLDIRRIFANCLRYNTSIKDSLRPVAVQVLATAEEMLTVFIAQKELPNPAPYPSLLYCWKLCVDVLDTLFNLVNPADGQPTALYFLYPVSFYCGGQFPPDYLEKVTKPMDFGTVTANLLEAKYQTVDDFAADCRLVVTNCLTYYSGRDDGRLFVEQANRLNDCLSQQLDQLARYDKSAKGAADRQKFATAVSTLRLPNPPPPYYVNILQELRALKYTDKATKITEPAMGPFEKPVSLQVFPDYLQHIQEAMDLSMVERKARSGVYTTPEDFEYDVNLIFRNCETYHSRRNGDHLVAMAKYGARQFRRIFYAKIRAFEDPSSVPAPKQERIESKQPSPDKSVSSAGPPAKRLKIDMSGISKGKSAPRITISAAAAQSSKSPKPPSSAGSLQKKISGVQQQQPKGNQPVPLHIAIARVKEAFPLRRALKSLQSWEADCARYFKELLRHPWLSAARPKFIFHVPVPDLFPELREAYAAKIRRPMDLTTVECQLLVGNRYAGPEDFVQDVALVFANAIRFNKDGRDIGDPLSCAYYDASVHLLRYSRWLSMELLSEHIEASDNVDEPGADGLPPFSWKLTSGNRKKAREEMEALVLNEPIEKSLEGDRWTWHEAECEKLLKALRHQSDLRYMTFFIQTNYPTDYAAFISRPMDWAKVQQTLKKRKYDKFGDVIDDLRLIFSNAFKYNERLKVTDPVSGQAYAAAQYMSAKLEVAINKLLLSVADRLERERIDHANAEREIEAAERAEEAAIRAAWKKDPIGKDASSAPITIRTDPSLKIRLAKRANQRREATDFEIPFFDEEDHGQHERSYFELVKFQKARFEKQRQELAKMRACTTNLGGNVFARMLQRKFAEEWLDQETKKAKARETVQAPALDGESKAKPNEQADVGADFSKASSVLGELEREGRGHLQIKLAAVKQKPKKTKKRPRFTFE